jgi:hypothetical protein
VRATINDGGEGGGGAIIPASASAPSGLTGLRSDCSDRIEGDLNSRLRVFSIRPLPRGTGAVGAATTRLCGTGGGGAVAGAAAVADWPTKPARPHLPAAMRGIRTSRAHCLRQGAPRPAWAING